ncbi:MAG: hypothetical protein IPK26_31435 [Planctomycetes bacterium]|nr:hypothetical protein [Planctomycetota bacterium]
MQLCAGNRGRLSARKRRLFRELADKEIAAMERVVIASGLADSPVR